MERATTLWRVGVLGLGVQGARLARRLEASGRFRVTAFFDPADGRSHGSAARCASAAQVAESSSVDVLFVATPPHLHEEGLALALAAGKPVLLEKPLAHSAEAAARMAAAAEAAHGALVGVNFWYASSAEGKALLTRAGQMGELASASLWARFAQWPRPFQRSAEGWLSEGGAGGGCTREVASHFFWLAVRTMGGEGWIVESKRVERSREEGGCETRVTALLRRGAGGPTLSIDMAVEGDAADTNRFELVARSGQSVGVRDWATLWGAEQPLRDEHAEAAGLGAHAGRRGRGTAAWCERGQLRGADCRDDSGLKYLKRVFIFTGQSCAGERTCGFPRGSAFALAAF